MNNLCTSTSLLRSREFVVCSLSTLLVENQHIAKRCLTLMIVPLLIIGCSGANNPEDDTVDPALVGEWCYRTAPYILDHPSPGSYNGFQITADKQFYYLGVETSTGKIERMEVQHSNLIKANAGIIVQQFFYCDGGSYNDTMSYNVVEDRWSKKLILDERQVDYYEPTALHTPIWDPLNVQFKATFVDSCKTNNIYNFEIPSIASSPGAYASRVSESELWILTPSSIIIKIKDFTGRTRYV